MYINSVEKIFLIIKVFLLDINTIKWSAMCSEVCQNQRSQYELKFYAIRIHLLSMCVIYCLVLFLLLASLE